MSHLPRSLFTLLCVLLLTVLPLRADILKGRIVDAVPQSLLTTHSAAGEIDYQSADKNVQENLTADFTSTRDEGEMLRRNELFRKLCDDIRELQLYLDPSFDRQAICERYHLTAVQVGNAFAQGSDYSSVSDFIRDCRLEYACQLLKTTDLKIGDVAARSGFTLVTTFNHDFKARYNLSPSEYRRRN